VEEQLSEENYKGYNNTIAEVLQKMIAPEMHHHTLVPDEAKHLHVKHWMNHSVPNSRGTASKQNNE